jgi:predicted RNase H-like nuclease (RuvC/YqgF family)
MMWEWLTKRRRITSLQQHVAQLSADTTEITADLASLREDVRTLRSEQLAFKREVESRDRDISRLTEQLAGRADDQVREIERIAREYGSNEDIKRLETLLSTEASALKRAEEHLARHISETDRRSTALLQRIEQQRRQ